MMCNINKTINYRVIGILNLACKKKCTTSLFLTSNLTDDILDCKMDAFFELENRKRFFNNAAKKAIYNNNYLAIEQPRYGFIFGETIKATLNDEGDIIGIDICEPFAFNVDIPTLIKEIDKYIKYLLNIIYLVRNNRIPIYNPIFYNVAEVFNRIKRIFIVITDMSNSSWSGDAYSEICIKIKKFYDKYEEIEWYGHDLLLDLSIILRDFINKKKNGIQTIRELNSVLYQFCEYEDYLIHAEELLYEISIFFNVEIEKTLVPRLNGKVINIIPKEIKKTSVKAHIRKTRMSKQKREEVLCFLEDNNIIIDNLGLITKENFERFDWDKMTIVEGFEKKIKSISLDENQSIEKYIDKELERQRKLDRANLIHQNLIRQMAYTLVENKLYPKYNRFIDLYCEIEEDNYILFEMKSITKDNCYTQLLKAFSQLMAYPYICNIKNNIYKCVVLSEKPREERLEPLFKENNINIIWLDNGIFMTYSWTNKKIINLLLNQVALY